MTRFEKGGMRYFAILLLALALFEMTCRAEHIDPSLKEGPCPSPPPAPDFSPTKLVGRWLDTVSTYELTRKAENNRRRCIENFIELDPVDGGLYVNTTYLDTIGLDVFTLYKKFIPVEDFPGKYTTIIYTTEGWQNHGWVYTIMSLDEDAFIEFGCKMVSDTHRREFHRIRSHSVPVPEEVVKKFMELARTNGDERPTFEYDHENCNYQDELAE